MARITVEDCVNNVPNPFELILLAAYRARRLGAGHEALVAAGNDNNVVMALREIAAGAVGANELRESLIRLRQTRLNDDDEVGEDPFMGTPGTAADVVMEPWNIDVDAAQTRPADDNQSGQDRIEAGV